jgi:hypothetical protein
MTTAAEMIARVRIRLDEPTAKFWTDPELLGWLNEGLRDAGRYTRHITDTRSINTVAGLSEYTVPADVIEVENVYYAPGDGRQIPLAGQSYENMNNTWGQWQNAQVGEPRAYALWGTPPSLRIKLYPSPELTVVGGISMLVTRMPAQAESVSATVDWPPAWEDVIEDYMEMAALRRARDPRWQEAFSFYTSKRDNLDVKGSYSNDPAGFVYDAYAGIQPRWLVGF